MSLLFVNYRSQEQPLVAKYLYDRLVRRFGRPLVYRDRDNLRGGQQYPEAIWSALGKSEVLLVLIGPNWLELRENGTRLIDRPRDWVRREIEQALTTGIHLVPVLLDGTTPLRAEQVPPSIRRLTTAQAIPVRADSLDDDVRVLVGTVAGLRTRSGPTVGQVARRRRMTIAWMSAVPVLVVVGVLLVLWRGDLSRAAPPGPGVVAPPTTGDVAPPTTTGDLVWHGDIAPGNGGVDLDRVPPARGTGADVIIESLSQVDTGPRGRIAIWDGERPPTRAGCASLLAGITEGVPAFDPAPGAMLCVRTDEGRFAVTEYAAPDRNGVLRLPTTVWN